MSDIIGRRKFFRNTAFVSAAGIALPQTVRATTAAGKDRVVIGIMGLNRGLELAKRFGKRQDVEIRYVSDVDETRLQKCLKQLAAEGHDQVKGLADFRQILDDPSVDAFVCAAPNHWHAPATILACQAGKHVYVEKPCSHTPEEGELMLQAARKHQRAVQVGTQRRSSGGTIQAIEQLRNGLLGRVYLARCWYDNARGSIGKQSPTTAPNTLNYELWQGPAPRRPFRQNVVHYNWHWRWHWGNGELGNNGVHTLDLCRWGLAADYPIRVTSSGGRYAYDDDQETPDTHTVCFDFEDDRSISWQGLSCNKHGQGFVTFYGTEGTLELQSNGNFRFFDRNNQVKLEVTDSNKGDDEHIENFIQAIQNDEASSLNASLDDGHKSALLCHLGNIAYRTNRSLACNGSNGQIKNDKLAARHWTRPYEPGWEPKVL
ncbi:MAG: Gfo/Idh/MocA family oxidoreductase [Planctomycetaceae bacterium]|nr:Gfo/Idh/MocA family oxidoreductase [Planctomycetaceae bacterium]